MSCSPFPPECSERSTAWNWLLSACNASDLDKGPRETSAGKEGCKEYPWGALSMGTQTQGTGSGFVGYFWTWAQASEKLFIFHSGCQSWESCISCLGSLACQQKVAGGQRHWQVPGSWVGRRKVGNIWLELPFLDPQAAGLGFPPPFCLLLWNCWY